MAKKPIKYVKIEIDDQPVEVPADQYILWSARELGFDIPHFCGHKWLEPFGGCRMCLCKVEMGGRMLPKLQITCGIKPQEGMKVWTRHPEVIRARKQQLEFHLINHPLECPVCDKGGECMLQDQTMDHGMGEGRYIEQKRLRPDEMVNEYIRINHKRCIHCKRCVNYTMDIAGTHFLKFIDRGADTYIVGFPSPEEAPHFSGNVIDMCPVGALTAQSYRFVMGRVWEQEQHASVGSLDSVGANIWVNTRLGDIARIIPRDNIEIENGMIDDATRFSWEAVESDSRVRKARANGDTLSRIAGEQEAARRLTAVAEKYGQDSIGIIAGDGLNTEDYAALRMMATRLSTGHFHFGSPLMGAQELSPDTVIRLTSGFGEITDILAATTVLSIGCDTFEEAPSLGLRLDVNARRGHQKLLSLRSHGSDADRFAKAAVRHGYGDTLRVVRALTNALAGEGDTIEYLQPLVDELKQVGEDLAIIYGQEVWRSPDLEELVEALHALCQAVATANPGIEGVYLNPVFPAVNTAGGLLVQHVGDLAAGAQELGRRPNGSLHDLLTAAAEGRLKALVLFDCDLLNEYPDRGLVEKALALVEEFIYVGPYPAAIAEHAKVQLPLGTWMHNEGTVVSMEWRVQKRSKLLTEASAPSVLDVINSVLNFMDMAPVAEDIEALSAWLRTALLAWPAEPVEDFPREGVLIKPRVRNTQGGTRKAQLPPEVHGGAERPLVVVPKRFLYNDRPEIKLSPVFGKVDKPFYAYLNPVDMKVGNITDGEYATLATDAGEAEVAVREASWVRPGSVVLNDRWHTLPVNRITGLKPAGAAIKKKVKAAGSK